jgi:hypothetical protein
MSYLMKLQFAGCFFIANLWSFAMSQADLYTKYETPRRLSVDLIFPKNETYKPQYKFPIVFALDPVAFWPFDFHFDYEIVTRIPGETKNLNWEYGGFKKGFHKQADSPVPESVGDSLVLINATKLLNNATELEVGLIYTVGFRRSCNSSIRITDMNDYGLNFGPLLSGWAEFRISNSSDTLLPNLNASSDCSQSIALFSIEGEMEAEGVHYQVGTCPIVQVEDAQGHCGRRMDEVLAAKVSTQILNDTCGEDYRKNPALMWPNPTATTRQQFCGSSAVRHTFASLMPRFRTTFTTFPRYCRSGLYHLCVQYHDQAHQLDTSVRLTNFENYCSFPISHPKTSERRGPRRL